MKPRIACSNSRVLRWMPRRICFSVNSANQRSTRLSQEAEVGVKCRWKRGRLASQRRIPWVLRAVVVQDEVHLEFCGHVACDGIEKSAKLAGTMTTMKLAQHVTAGHVESREQAGGAVAFVVVAARSICPGRMGRKYLAGCHPEWPPGREGSMQFCKAKNSSLRSR